MTLVFYIDADIHRQSAEKEGDRQQRLTRRSPSPVPSSASAMYEEERQREVTARENPDERRLDRMPMKEKPSKTSIPFK